MGLPHEAPLLQPSGFSEPLQKIHSKKVGDSTPTRCYFSPRKTCRLMDNHTSPHEPLSRLGIPGIGCSWQIRRHGHWMALTENKSPKLLGVRFLSGTRDFSRRTRVDFQDSKNLWAKHRHDTLLEHPFQKITLQVRKSNYRWRPQLLPCQSGKMGPLVSPWSTNNLLQPLVGYKWLHWYCAN